MSIPAGDIKEIAIDHDDLGGRIFEAKSGEDGNVKKGGFTSTDDDNNITSTGKRIDVMNYMAWSMETTIGANPGDLDFMQSLSSNTKEGTYTVTFMDGTVRSGNGKPVGDIVENKQAGTIAFKIQGSGTLDEI